MYIAFDIGGTSIKHAVITDEGEILKKSSLPTPQTGSNFLSVLIEIINIYQKKYNIKGIGISAPGIVSADGVMTTFGALKKMYGMPLQGRLSALTGFPVAVENDANEQPSPSTGQAALKT